MLQATASFAVGQTGQLALEDILEGLDTESKSKRKKQNWGYCSNINKRSYTIGAIVLAQFLWGVVAGSTHEPL